MTNKNIGNQNQKQEANSQANSNVGENKTKDKQRINESKNENNKKERNIINEEPELPGHNDNSGKTIREIPRMSSL